MVLKLGGVDADVMGRGDAGLSQQRRFYGTFRPATGTASAELHVLKKNRAPPSKGIQGPSGASPCVWMEMNTVHSVMPCVPACLGVGSALGCVPLRALRACRHAGMHKKPAGGFNRGSLIFSD